MRIFASFLLLLVGFSFSAKAEVTIWTDPDFGVVIAYPDGWTKQVNKHDGERLFIVAPSAQDMAQCKMNVEEDERFEIYPKKYLKDIVSRELNDSFWRQYFVNYDDVKIGYFAEGGGLGSGYATYVDFAYKASFNGQARQMRGVAYATIYHDMRVVVECSSDARRYPAWFPLFSGVMKSVTFEPAFHGRAWGEYRNFFRDYDVLYPVGRGYSAY